MPTFPCRLWLRVAACATLATLVACSKGGDEMAWARAALERNGELEIVAADDKARTFTVKDKATGELRIVRADEISGAPVSASAPAVADAQAQPETAPMPEPVDPLAGEPDGPPEPEAASRPPATREPVDAGGSGRVIASGPGYSIKASETPTPQRSAQSELAGAAVERRSEPLVCQGSRFLRIDGRNIAFDGDALKAQEGCELYITNSRITARGVGLDVRGANVHIKNSTVAGESGAIHASGNAQIYAQSSRFMGMVRRLDDAVLHDMGDNVWN